MRLGKGLVAIQNLYRDQKVARGKALCRDMGHDMATQGAQQATIRPLGPATQPGQAATRPVLGHDTALAPAACAHRHSQGVHLVHPTLFGLNTLFLSHCWNTVHEHCS